MNLNECYDGKVLKFCSTLTLIRHNFSSSGRKQKNLVLLKKKYQKSFSEILNAIALLGAKFIYSFPWELSFVLKP